MNFYNYIIGRLYSWGLRRKNDTPIANVVFTMCIVHYFQLFILYMVFQRFFGFPDIILGINKMAIVVFMALFFVAYYFIFYKREKWERYAQEVEKEDKHKRRRGKFLVLLYLIGSTLLFFICLPLLFGFGR